MPRMFSTSRFLMCSLIFLASCITGFGLHAQQSPIEQGTSSTFQAQSNAGTPTPTGPYSCTKNRLPNQTCNTCGSAAPNGNITWTVDGSTVQSTSDSPLVQTVQCGKVGTKNVYGTYQYDTSVYQVILPTGSHTIVASIPSSQDPSAAFSTSWTVQVNPAGASTTTTLATSAQSTNYGDMLNLSAAVTSSGSDAPSGLVNFLDGTTIIGSGAVYNGQARASVNNLQAGSHNITAQYYGDADSQSSASSQTTVSVQSGPPQLTIQPSAMLAEANQPLDLMVALTSNPANEPQGMVSCTSGSGSTGEVALASNATAHLTLSSIPVGPQTIQCSFTDSTSNAVVNGNVSINSMSQGANSVGALETARSQHTANLLRDGTVLVAGGRAAGQYEDVPLASAEIYTPSTGQFSAATSLLTARYFHTGTTLADGTVLMAGGSGPNSVLASAEYYDPSTRSFKTTGSLNTARMYHAAVLLNNGTVLIVGGRDSNDNATPTAEIYNPNTGLFTNTGSMQQGRAYPSAVLLPNGQVLVAGGEDNAPSPIASAEIYNPATGTFSSAGNMSAGRVLPQMAEMTNGNVLIGGGLGGGPYTGNAIASADVFNVASGSFSPTGSMTTARAKGSAVATADGRVFIFGGQNSTSILSSIDVYDPTTGAFTSGGSMVTARQFFPATLLTDSSILLAGGETSPISDPARIAATEAFAGATESGGVTTKYKVLGVIYSPPGANSSVTYSDTHLFTNTATMENIVKTGVNVSTSNTFGAGILGFGVSTTLTTSSEYDYTEDNSHAYTTSRSQANGIKVAGPADSSIGIDHDQDLVTIWLNPIADVTVTPGVSNSLLWTGFSFDPADTNSVGNMDIAVVPIFCLKEPNYQYCQPFHKQFSRDWDLSGAGGLTQQDFQNILQSDPYASNPNYDPTQDSSNRYTVQTGTIQYVPAAPGQGSQQYSNTESVTNSTTYSSSTSNMYAETIGVKVGFGASSAAADIKATLSVSASASWTDRDSLTNAASTTDSASYTINSPLSTDPYTGPSQFNAWLDNLYQSFMFYSPNRSTVPSVSLTPSSGSLSFPVVQLGQAAPTQQITITNNNTSSTSVSFAAQKMAAISFSSPSYTQVANSCLGTTLAAGASCSITVQFAPAATDLPTPGQTQIPGVMTVAGTELAPGSTNVLLTTQVSLSGTGNR